MPTAAIDAAGAQRAWYARYMPKLKNAANISRTNTVTTSIFNAELLPLGAVVLK
jgi:hypothetical protein